jgi:WD40 repeat protein
VNKKITTISMLENTYSFAVGSEKGEINIFRIDYLSKRKGYGALETIKRIEVPEEGDVISSLNFINFFSENMLMYITQKGFLHIHDLRVKKDVVTSELGCQRGLVSCMCLGKEENSVFIGTLGGYIVLYDLRFNLTSNVYQHSKSAPIHCLTSFIPSKTKDSKEQYGFIKSDSHSPLVFIGAGSENPEITLFNMEKSEYEMKFTFLQKEAVDIPYLFVENPGTTNKSTLLLKKLRSKSTILDENIKEIIENQRNSNSSEWLHNFQNRYSTIKQAFSSECIINRILCPRLGKTGGSVSYMIAGGTDRKMRYWDLQKDNIEKLSYYINTPDDRECLFHASLMGDVSVIQEEVLPKRENIYPSNERGLSAWQNLNGSSYVGSLMNVKGQTTKLANASHNDAILDMNILPIQSGPYLISCSRDSMVKIWS